MYSGSVRESTSQRLAVNPVLELDVLVGGEFGLNHKNLLVLNTGKLTSWRFLRERFRKTLTH
jgi:hypothetical protein